MAPKVLPGRLSRALDAISNEAFQKISSRDGDQHYVIDRRHLVLRQIPPVLGCRNNVRGRDIFQSLSLRTGKSNGSAFDGTIENLVEAWSDLYRLDCNGCWIMEQTAELAGLFAAHAIWCVSDGDTLIPMLAFEGAGGTQEMHRLVTENLEDGVAQGKEWLAANPESASRAVLIYDGFIPLESGKTDALILEAVEFHPERRSLTMAVPYRHAESPEGFAVYRPKFLGFEGPEPSYEVLGAAFFRGVDQHEKGAAVWNANIDQSK